MKTEYLFFFREVSRNHLYLYLYGMVYTSIRNWDVRKEESILVSEIKKISIFLLTIATNDSDLFENELILRWE